MIEVVKYSDIPEGYMKHIEIKNIKILMVNVEGTIYAIDDCSGQMNTSLSFGKLEGKIIECVLYHPSYDIIAGKNLVNNHLGNIFDDEPQSTGKRFCINSL